MACEMAIWDVASRRLQAEILNDENWGHPCAWKDLKMKQMLSKVDQFGQGPHARPKPMPKALARIWAAQEEDRRSESKSERSFKSYIRMQFPTCPNARSSILNC